MKINDEGTSNAAHWYERAMKAESRLAEAERDAARYRFIKRWGRRLDITGYSLTNNEYFELRIDQAMGRTADSADQWESNRG